jgi:large subunit ribosomal protein L1
LAINFGKASFSASDLTDNLNVIIDVVNKARPSTIKGVYVRSCTVSSTYGPGIRIAM